MRGQIVTDVTVAATPTSLSGMSYFTASRCITSTSNRHASLWDFLPPDSFSSETAFHQRRYTRSRRADALRLCAPSASISVRLSTQHHMRTARITMEIPSVRIFFLCQRSFSADILEVEEANCTEIVLRRPCHYIAAAKVDRHDCTSRRPVPSEVYALLQESN